MAPLHTRIRRIAATIDFTSTQPINTNTPPPWTIDIPPCNTELLKFPKHDTPNLLILNSFRAISNKYTEYNHIYTDASKCEEGVGAAVISEHGSDSYKLSKSCSVYTGELYALSKAIMKARRTDGNTVIYTDSLSSVEGIQQLYPRHPILQKIKSNLAALYQGGKKVEIVWVPSHTGIPGNEKADEMARNSSTSLVSRIMKKIPYQDLYNQIKSVTSHLWKVRWQTLTTNKLYKLNPNMEKPNYSGLSRKHQTILTRLRIGHTRLTHQHILKKEPPPNCNWCYTTLTVQHLFSCPQYQQYRNALLLPSDISILSNTNFRKVIQYISDIKITNIL
ncbi:uncharacterized protein [Leptinotarsa decemlineata]|uniref:uncharacterized protein n=1 Tax=Leptinotarsa decemlineata TaxID=7539 RepID=UPI003D307530